MRGTVGDIVAGGGAPLATALYDEIGLIAAANGHPLQSGTVERAKAMLTAAGSPFNSSMARDVENGFRTEAEHVVGDLLKRAKGGSIPCSRPRSRISGPTRRAASGKAKADLEPDPTNCSET